MIANSIRVLFLAMIVVASASLAHAGEKQFVAPKYKGARLDWCVDWAKDCGKPAADLYCKVRGYDGAKSFSIAEDIGLDEPTRLIGTGAICDQEACDGFDQIVCVSGQGQGKTYSNPSVGGQRIDWCVNWAKDCGKPAADLFCQKQGYGVAASFAIDKDIGGQSPTRLLGTGAICDQDLCDGFADITCVP